MEAIEAIRSRRMQGTVTDVRPERAQIETLLDLAVRAPTHHITEPWRFVVLAGPELEALGEAFAARLAKKLGDGATEDKLDLERGRPKRAPVIITVVYTPSTHPKAVKVEDRHAIGAAMQNILIAAHAHGLGASLRTGPPAFDADIRKHLGLAENEEIAGFIYVGYPNPALETPGEMSRRTPAAERTEWRGWT